MSLMVNKLDEKLKIISYEKRKEINNILTLDDIDYIFDILCINDIELNPILYSYKILIQTLYNEYYLVIEEELKKLLTYYKIIPDKHIINCRHQYFFTDDKKMIKKNYFPPEKLQYIKESFENHKIFQKMGIV